MSAAADTARAAHGTGYVQAVAACVDAITRGAMRPAVLQDIAQRFGVSASRLRQAYHEVARALAQRAKAVDVTACIGGCGRTEVR